MLFLPHHSVAGKDTAGTAFRLGPGDVVNVFILNQPDYSLAVTIGPDGTVNYPLAGNIEAVGLTLLEFEQAILTGLSKHLRNPKGTATLKEVQSYRVYIMGEVLRPGVFRSTTPITLIQALSMAGGFTPFASRKDIVIYNYFAAGDRRLTFDYDSFILQGKNDGDIRLISGDTIIVK